MAFLRCVDCEGKGPRIIALVASAVLLPAWWLRVLDLLVLTWRAKQFQEGTYRVSLPPPPRSHTHFNS